MASIIIHSILIYLLIIVPPKEKKVFSLSHKLITVFGIIFRITHVNFKINLQNELKILNIFVVILFILLKFTSNCFHSKRGFFSNCESSV